MDEKTLRHASSLVDAGAVIGPGVRLGSFVHVHQGATLDAEACIEGNTSVPPRVRIGKSVQVGHSVAFVPPLPGTSTEIEEGAVIGTGALIGAGVRIGASAIVAPGTHVHRSIPTLARVEGVPAQIVGYVGADASRQAVASPDDTRSGATQVRGVRRQVLKLVKDIRGNLSVGDFEREVPFVPKRYFLVFEVPSQETRGEHAHKECHQFLVCVRGSCAVVADDGARREEFILDRPDIGIYLPPMVWGIQYKYSRDAVLLVFASHHYDVNDYIREYGEFQRLARKEK